MSESDLKRRLSEAQARVADLQSELNRTNSELMQLTLALDDQVAERTAELQDSQHFLDTVFQSIQDGLCVVGTDLTIQQANDWLKELFHEQGELVGRSCHAVFMGRSSACVNCPVLHVMSTSEPASALIPHPDSNEPGGWLEHSAFPHRNGGGELLGVIVHFKNVTERERARLEMEQLQQSLEDRVERRTDELAAANRELEAFAYSVSHDLRAPLRAMDGFSQALLEDFQGNLGEAGQDYLMRIRRASRKMAQLIDDLLALSRVTQRELRMARVDLSAMAREILDELARQHPDRAVSVEVADDLVVVGDTRLLRIALQNLLGNSWKYTAKKPHAHIQMVRVADDSGSSFAVIDDGVGFDSTYATNLFKPFQRLHTESQFEGSGIGLATVDRIIRRHGGQVRGEGVLGTGATFTFSLPQRWLGQDAETTED